ncbi:MAG: hypothetical protein H0W87_06975 [Actinobacteria bacterium]|nr:hypothetical protein [Actinomycetota bacterium]
MTIALILGAALALACVLFVARPFLLDPEAEDDVLDEPTAQERRWIELAERRDRALAALKELEFDHMSGKISDEDYRSLVGALRQQAAEALRSLETTERSLMRNLEPPRQPDIPEPYPPPGELDPPSPPDIPEPYPPPGETQPPPPPQIPEPYPPAETQQ